MVNKDRIVPIQKVDFLTLIGIILNLMQTEHDVLPAEDVEGNFTVSAQGTYLADQPVKTLNFEEDGSVFFVPAYDFAGVQSNGEAVEADIEADGISLYVASCLSGTVTVDALSPSAE